VKTTINKAVTAALLVGGALIASGALHDGELSWAELLAAVGTAIPAGAVVWRVPYFKRTGSTSSAAAADVSRET
jgi:hypothetical protein